MIIATNNKGKLREIKEILSDFDLFSLEEKGIEIDVVEDADSFLGNALKKAKEIYELTNEATIADDSGICIDALGGWPGVMTHRFLGENSTKDERNDAMLEKMQDQADRTARVVCNMVYYDGVDTIVGEGVIVGKIAMSKRGDNGFGFDDIFEIEDGRTLAELSHEEKNKISARYLALVDLKEKLNAKKLKKTYEN